MEAEAPVRVAHVVRSFGALSQTFITDAILEMDRLGWEGWVVTNSVSNREHFPFPPPQRLLEARRPSLLRLAWNRTTFRSAAERRAAWLAPGIASIQPAVIHAHMGWAAIDALPAARRLGVPLLPGFHGTDLTVRAGDPQERDAYAALFRGVRRARVNSQFLGRVLRSRGFTGQIDVIPTGIRFEEFPFRGPRPISGEARLLFIGRQVPCKGLDVLLRALARLPDRPAVRLDVIGEGPQEGENRALAARLGIDRRVVFHGARPRAAVRAALDLAQLVVVPSRTDETGAAEALGNATKEAQAVGVPVVATTNGGIPETIPPEHRHELVPENDDMALAARIAAVLGDAPSWEGKARHARRWVEQNFGWEALGRRLGAVYAELVEEANRAASPREARHHLIPGRPATGGDE
jgi:colanic acid/amylovoran biosynthesis glycosyltransferase